MSNLVALGSVAEINPRLPRGIDESQQVSFLTMASVSEDGRILEEEIRILGETKKGYTYFERGDVLIAKITPCFENGKAALVDQLKHQVGFGSTEFHVIRVHSDKLDARYLFYLVWSDLFRFYGGKSMTGAAGQKRVSSDFLKAFEIPLPPLPEQRRIAAILDKADAIRRKRQEAIRLTEDFLRSVFLDMFGDPVTNPKGWEVGTIRDLVSEVKYGTSQKAGTEGEYPILRMGNLTYQGGWNFSDLKYIDIPRDDREKYLVHKGDLLFNRTNSKELVGKTAVFNQEEPMAYAGYLIRVRPNEQNKNEYISAYLNSEHGKQILVGMCKSIVGMANINAQELQDIKILKAPLEEQKKYQAIVTAVDTLRNSQAEPAALTNGLFNSLVQRAFRGDL